MARFDLGITLDEFWDLTPGMFQALCKRRNIAIRYDRYASALTASAVYNVHRGSADDPVVVAYDFIRPEAEAIALQKVRDTQRYVKQVIGQLPMSTPRAKYLEIRDKTIADLRVSGHSNAEELFDQVWPHLKPTEAERQG